MRAFLDDPDASIRHGSPVIPDLIYGWGNVGWSAPSEYLVRCVECALASEGPSLECGSGLSTILVGAVAAKMGYTHWVLEHTQGWADRVQACLRKYGVDSVASCTKPLRDYGEFVWYDPPLESMPDEFALVVCDGPPSDTRGGRYGLVPIMKERLGPGCIVLLDDAIREHEQLTAMRWEAQLGARVWTREGVKPWIEMVISDGPRGGRS
jgi:hypothetical protein